MECTDSAVALLCDFEVYDFLRTAPVAVAPQVTAYFDKIHPACTAWTVAAVSDFMSKIMPFQLSKHEKLLILNSRPPNLVCLLTCIENADERFSEEEISNMLNVVHQTLPARENPQQIDAMEVP